MMPVTLVLSTGEKMVFRNGACVSDDLVSWWRLTAEDLEKMFEAARASRHEVVKTDE